MRARFVREDLIAVKAGEMKVGEIEVITMDRGSLDELVSSAQENAQEAAAIVDDFLREHTA